MMKNQEPKEFHLCVCKTCEKKVRLPWKEFMKHCKNVHGLKEGEEGTRTVLMHIDGRDFYEWIYICKFGDKVEFLEVQRNIRRGKNADIWESL